MGCLIFYLFTEDKDIFNGKDLFTSTIEQMSAKYAPEVHGMIGEIFRTMNFKAPDRQTTNIMRWEEGFLMSTVGSSRTANKQHSIAYNTILSVWH